jgi:uncharacterized short protein YbdD (DUF466 family)
VLRQIAVAWYWVREFFGENAYERYVAEWQARHAGMPPDSTHRMLTQREFFSSWIERRYGVTTGRC